LLKKIKCQSRKQREICDINGFFYLWQSETLGYDINTIEKDNIPGWHIPATRSFVLTAHHADDSIETLLMNFFRGTGLHGLTGIPISGPSAALAYIKRPLLPFSKKELIAFANENKLEFVEDSSNLSIKYTRNLFRHEIIPAISKVYPQVNENLTDQH
jgi:tRNA(Ile)-lysidine synthase TilS/MesJ